MKKLIIAIIATIAILIGTRAAVLAADSTPSSTSTQGGTVNKKAQDILNKVTSQVAQTQAKRTYHGKIKSVGTSSYMITTSEGDRTITTNDVTVFFKIRAGSRAEVNFSGLKVGDDIAALGTIDPQSGDMTARQVIAKIKRTVVIGTVDGIDKDVYTVKDSAGNTTKINFGDSLSFKKTVAGKIVPARQSDIKVGLTVFVLSYISDPTAGTTSALKVLVLTAPTQ